MSHTEYGIQSPNGQTSWGVFIGRPLETEQDRATLSIILHKTAQELGWPDDDFVDRFRWVTRTISEDPGQFKLDDPEVVEVVPESAPPPRPVRATPKRRTRKPVGE